jgi:hypothetical protein
MSDYVVMVLAAVMFVVMLRDVYLRDERDEEDDY